MVCTPLFAQKAELSFLMGLFSFVCVRDEFARSLLTMGFPLAFAPPDPLWSCFFDIIPIRSRGSSSDICVSSRLGDRILGM